MARTAKTREEKNLAVDKINISSTDSPEDSQDVAGGKCKKSASNFQDQPVTHPTSIAQSQLMLPGASSSQLASPPIINQPSVSLHGASNVQGQLVTYPTSIAQSQSTQPTLPPNTALTYNSYLAHYPYYESYPPYKLAYVSSYYMALPVVQYAQPISQEPPSDPNTTGALPSTLAPVVQPYNPANPTHMQGPTPQSTQLLLPILAYQMPQPSNSVAIQNQVVNVPRSREDDETVRSKKPSLKRKRGRPTKNTEP